MVANKRFWQISFSVLSWLMTYSLLNINTFLFRMFVLAVLRRYNYMYRYVYFHKLVLTRVNLICWVCRYWGVRKDHHYKANEDHPYKWIWYEVSFFNKKKKKTMICILLHFIKGNNLSLNFETILVAAS